LTAVVVFPTPPFWLAMVTIRPIAVVLAASAEAPSRGVGHPPDPN
jgi:hypothetical protein